MRVGCARSALASTYGGKDFILTLDNRVLEIDLRGVASSFLKLDLKSRGVASSFLKIRNQAGRKNLLRASCARGDEEPAGRLAHRQDQVVHRLRRVEEGPPDGQLPHQVHHEGNRQRARG